MAKGHNMGDMKGGSMKKIGPKEFEATIRFKNGVEGTGRGATPALAQHNAVEHAKSKGGIGLWVLLGAIVLLGAGL